MIDRRKYGLQLVCIQPASHRMEQYTPRNLDIARAMAESHAATHDGYWIYRTEDWSLHSDHTPEVWDTLTLAGI